jgi:tetratricopeptide (TPR) repeat protein
MDDVTDILDQGIAAKRAGKYDLALQFYNKAKTVSPLDVRIFNNTFRIHFGLEHYEDALRNLLIIASFNRIDRLIEKDMLNSETRALFNEFRGKFRSTNLLYKKGDFSSVMFEPELIPEAIKKDGLLNDFVLRADNLTYYIGHSFIGMHPSIKTSHNVPEDGFKNLSNSLLGTPTGYDLREHKTSGLFYCIGFIFSHMNLNFKLHNKEDVVEYFLNPKTQLNFDLSRYRDFLHNLNIQ